MEQSRPQQAHDGTSQEHKDGPSRDVEWVSRFAHPHPLEINLEVMSSVVVAVDLHPIERFTVNLFDDVSFDAFHFIIECAEYAIIGEVRFR